MTMTEGRGYGKYFALILLMILVVASPFCGCPLFLFPPLPSLQNGLDVAVASGRISPGKIAHTLIVEFRSRNLWILRVMGGLVASSRMKNGRSRVHRGLRSETMRKMRAAGAVKSVGIRTIADACTDTAQRSLRGSRPCLVV